VRPHIKQKSVGDLVQVIQDLPGKHKAVGSNSNAEKEREREERKKKKEIIGKL
jgi:hypothetical protein